VKNQQRVGLVLVQETIRNVQKVLLEATGMGRTGESYLVGADYRLRSLSRFFPDKPPNTIIADTEAVQNSFLTGNGNGTLNDYRDIKV
jgi:hypothetical protein